MRESLKSIFFAVLLCLACSILLTAASTGLQDRQNKNMAVDKQKNILLSVALVDPEKTYTAEEIESLYAATIKSFRVDSAGRILTPSGDVENSCPCPIYLYLKDGHIEAYIVPIDSKGLWGRILGYLAIGNDGSTITGFTVYKHSETPGLGGEIERNWFQKNFVGKKIINRQGDFASISVAKGAVKDIVSKEQQINYVDGISGATLTGKFLTAGIKDVLLDYEPVSVRFRRNKIKGLKIEDNEDPNL
jgi:Na+-transporting NADH:ubiquinone oxidoreductase subunit C